MKRVLKFFGIFALLASAAAGAYYFFFVRARNPQVELYFDDGSMLAFPGNTGRGRALCGRGQRDPRSEPHQSLIPALHDERRFHGARLRAA